MNRSRIREGVAISLFPFLAVLLCTMGALLVLLVLFGYSAGQQDKAAAVAEAEAVAAELRLAIENLSWRRDQLAEMRAKSSADLESLRLRLAGIEENSRGLRRAGQQGVQAEVSEVTAGGSTDMDTTT